MTTNELQAARDEHADAQESLSVEFETEFGEIVTLRNALESADTLIAALEAHAADQQQRIERLEAALADIVNTKSLYNDLHQPARYLDAISLVDMPDYQSVALGFAAQFLDHVASAHEALRDEPGVE